MRLTPPEYRPVGTMVQVVPGLHSIQSIMDTRIQIPGLYHISKVDY